ncbi:hypothetical protein [Alkalihalobacterium chitinilyticum]|uniref:Uncharacterized protein n=1 Tax=Alkalihalobacterium chitinilyticum TaxID=2980103 RepID=A0ABT5VDY2_9BACI|nr:hypothetical protein [Alkalihalobacterium chitinilyticum]MDE5413663.1 hypothetical protein [Alkalihalobacterium chitinilyticum]
METEVLILTKKTGVVQKDAQIIAKIVNYARTLLETKNIQIPSIRSSIIIATIAQKTKMTIDPKNKSFLMLCKDVLYKPIFNYNTEETEEALIELMDTLRRWDFEK